jgi:hypothetical protein
VSTSPFILFKHLIQLFLQLLLLIVLVLPHVEAKNFIWFDRTSSSSFCSVFLRNSLLGESSGELGLPPK